MIAVEKLSKPAIGRLVCRGKYKPPKNPKDPPGDNQKPDSKKDNDGGGDDGDGGRKSPKGPKGPGGGSWLGGTLSFLFWLGVGAFHFSGLGLAIFFLGLLGSIPRDGDDPPIGTTGIIEPPVNPDTPINPPGDDKLGQQIYEVLKIDFDRWMLEEDFNVALKTAADCAVDYRLAIRLLRKVLRSKSTVENLGAKMFEDYKKRRAWLIYNFIELRNRFADKWLSMENYNVEVSFIDIEGYGRKLQVIWDKLPQDRQNVVTAVTLYHQGRPIKTMEHFEIRDSMFLLDVPDFDLSNGTEYVVKIYAFAATIITPEDDEGYAFTSQGKPATGTYVEVSPRCVTADANEFVVPEGMELRMLSGPNDDPSSQFDKKAYPIFQAGQYTYWRKFTSALPLI